MGDAVEARASRFLELSPDGLRRRFLIVVPQAHVERLRAERLGEMQLGPDPGPGADARLVALRRRLEAGALTDAQQKAGKEAIQAVSRRLGLRAAGSPRLDVLATPAGGDLVLHAEVEALPEAEPPDPASLRIEKLVPRPDPAEADRALAALAASRAALAELPPGSAAAEGNTILADIEVALLPPPNRIPNPGLDGAGPGSLPDGWRFGDNNSGLEVEVLAAEAGANPPFLRLRLHGSAAADGQTYVMFSPDGAIPAATGSTWAGSLALRQAAVPVGLRGGKLRLESKPATGGQTLRRKDAALSFGAGFMRIYVSDSLAEATTGSVRLAVLFDHAAGPVDFTMDLALPRLVEGLDLGTDQPLVVAELGGEAQRLGPGLPDPLGLAPHLSGLRAGASHAVEISLPTTLPDRALAGRPARILLHPRAVLHRQVPPVDAALATALGFDGLDALRAWAASRVAERQAQTARLLLRRAVLDALIAGAPELPLPEDAVRSELATIWPRLVAEAEARGAQPDQIAAHALAARRVRLGLLLGALARRHGIAPDDADLRAAATALRDATPEAIRAQALEDRCIAFLLARVQVTEREADAAELAAALR